MNNSQPNKKVDNLNLESVISELTLKQLFYIKKNLKIAPEIKIDLTL